jgi:hypothetical protein
MKRLGIAIVAGGFVSFARAADLPTTKPPAESAKANCWVNVWDRLHASASDCPISAYAR